MTKSQIKLLSSLFILGLVVFQALTQKGSVPSENVSVSPTNYSTSAQQNEHILSATDSAQFALVTRVVDGDTIVINSKQTVRLIGINTPETVDPRRPPQCFGTEASNKIKELLLNQQVRLEKDISETDKYHRLLRYVYRGDEMINETLVREGFAQAVSYPPDVKYLERLRAAEKEAREANRGLWGACPSGP